MAGLVPKTFHTCGASYPQGHAPSIQKDTSASAPASLSGSGSGPSWPGAGALVASSSPLLGTADASAGFDDVGGFQGASSEVQGGGRDLGHDRLHPAG